LEANTYAQIKLNAEQIQTKVGRDGIISEINQTAENITIKANKIDLVGLVEADELVAKYATVTTLMATEASLKNLIAEKATIEELNVTNAKIDGKLEVSQFTADTIVGKLAGQLVSVKRVNCGEFCFQSSDVSWKERTVVTAAGTETIYYLGR